jgi:lauroyl/myristoyl acyltransferase
MSAPLTRRASTSKRLVRRLNRITNRRPALGLRLAAIVGFTLGPWLGDAWWLSDAELEELLGEIDPRTRRRLQRRIAAGELRNRALAYLLHHDGPEKLIPRIRICGDRAFRSLLDDRVPVVVLYWHQGVPRSVETALHSLGHPILAAIDHRPPGPDPGYRWLLASDRPSRSRYLMEALKAVRDGGVPVFALDGPGPESQRFEFLGRSLPIPGGAGLLAGRGGARLVPASSRWLGLSSRLEVTLHEPLPEPARGARGQEDWEREIVARAVAWSEEHIRAHPENLRPVSVRHMLGHLRAAPRAPSDADFARLAEEFDAG